MKDLARLARLVLPLWRWLVLGILLALATVLAHIGLLALSSWFIASMAISGAGGVLFNYATPSAGVRALALARAGGRYAERLVNHGTTLRVLSSIRVWFYTKIEPLAPARLERHRSGDLLSRIRADIDVLDDFYVRGLVPTFVALLSVACIVPFLMHFDGRLVAVDLAGLAFAGFLLPLLLRRPAARAGRGRVAAAAELRASLVEGIQGMAELEALGADDLHEAEVMAAARDMDRRQRTIASLQGIGEAGAFAASALAAGAAAYVLAPLVSAGSVPPADLAMLIVFMIASFEAVLPLPAVIQKAGELAAAARRLFEIIDTEPGVPEPSSPATLSPSDRPPDAVDLAIRGLSFRYAEDQPWVLRDFSMEAAAGARIGIRGPTGAGKSTLVSILLRFRQYDHGVITVREPRSVDGVELRSLTGDGARRLFSVVPQSPWLFHASVRENLAIADETASDEALWAALRTAALSDLVSALPEGLDSIVGETGRELSVGEGRRLAIARALLRSAPAYILDEPTEGLDDSTAGTVLEAVHQRLRDRTLIIISHRPRDLAGLDTVLDMGISGAVD